MAFNPGSDGYFFNFLSLSKDVGGAADGISFYQLLQQDGCNVAADALLSLQCNLFNAFLDRFRTAPDATVDAGLNSMRPLFNMLWEPAVTRTLQLGDAKNNRSRLA